MNNLLEHTEEQSAAITLVSDKGILSLDTLGIAASVICLIHCLAMPFIISILPLIGFQFLESKLAHEVLAVFVFCFAGFAIVPGYLKHKKLNVLIGMVIGLGLVLAATCLCGYVLPEQIELPIISIGNLILVATHWSNHHLVACEHHHC